MKTDYVEWDKTLPCFGRRIRVTGNDTYIIQYRDGGAGTKQRKITLGSTKVLSEAEAREAARRILKQHKLSKVGGMSEADYFA
jgi:hypothetical protein